MDTENLNWIAPLLHFSDSALPVGAYAHSFGLEGMCQIGVVNSVEDLEEFLLRDVSHALLQIDLPLVAKAHAATMDGLLEELRRLDQLSWATRPTRQLREAASKIGKQQLAIYQRTWGERQIVDLPHQQSPVVMGMAYAYKGVPSIPSLWSISYQTYSALVQSALKLLPIGPSATQRLLHVSMQEIGPKLKTATALPEEEIGSFNPLWDIAAARHERAPARLFIS